MQTVIKTTWTLCFVLPAVPGTENREQKGRDATSAAQNSQAAGQTNVNKCTEKHSCQVCRGVTEPGSSGGIPGAPNSDSQAPERFTEEAAWKLCQIGDTQFSQNSSLGHKLQVPNQNVNSEQKANSFNARSCDDF